MERTELLQVVRERLVHLQAADGESVAEDALLLDLLPDSLAMVELVLDLEDALGVELPESEVSGVRSVAELLDLLSAKA